MSKKPLVAPVETSSRKLVSLSASDLETAKGGTYQFSYQALSEAGYGFGDWVGFNALRLCHVLE